jgi:hypothetical protein
MLSAFPGHHNDPKRITSPSTAATTLVPSFTADINAIAHHTGTIGFGFLAIAADNLALHRQAIFFL